MDSISNLASPTSSSYKQQEVAEASASASTAVAKPQEVSSKIPVEKQYLQPDPVDISEASKKKLSEAEKEKETSTEKDGETNFTVAKEGEVNADNKTNESDKDKAIRELSIEIIEISLKIETLKAKEDTESAEEVQELEVVLAMKKGQLEAMVKEKLQGTKKG